MEAKIYTRGYRGRLVVIIPDGGRPTKLHYNYMEQDLRRSKLDPELALEAVDLLYNEVMRYLEIAEETNTRQAKRDYHEAQKILSQYQDAVGWSTNPEIQTRLAKVRAKEAANKGSQEGDS